MTEEALELRSPQLSAVLLQYRELSKSSARAPVSSEPLSSPTRLAVKIPAVSLRYALLTFKWLLNVSFSYQASHVMYSNRIECHRITSEVLCGNEGCIPVFVWMPESGFVGRLLLLQCCSAFLVLRLNTVSVL